MLSYEDEIELQRISTKLRKCIIDMTFSRKSGHPGGSMSCIDIILFLYKKVLQLTNNEKDSFILSKGHAAPALYSVLYEMDYINHDKLLEYRTNGGALKGHPRRLYTNGVEIGLGSLGMGLSIAIGEAIANRINNSNGRVYVLMGDGELNEGQVWEAFMCAAHYKLNNLVAIIDLNGLQLDGRTCDVMNNNNLTEKLRGFGWQVLNTDGHSFTSLCDVFIDIEQTEKPTCIIADTIKGKGVSYMENNVEWHSFRLKNEFDKYYEIASSELMF